ncbi:MAG: hypothetical protein Q4C70_13205, partial [Planctomycetia bacterium]|nr:hypothetical protein [Planctomycetia bacterium]
TETKTENEFDSTMNVVHVHSFCYHLVAALVMLDAEETEAGTYLAKNFGWTFVPFPLGRLEEKYRVPATFATEFPWETFLSNYYKNPHEDLEARLATLLYAKTRHGKQPDQEECLKLWNQFMEEFQTDSWTILETDVYNFADLTPEMKRITRDFCVKNWSQTDDFTSNQHDALLSLAEYFVKNSLNEDESCTFLFRLI